MVCLTCVCAKSLQLCPAPCDLMSHNLPGSSVHGVLQARVLEWVAMPSSRGSPWHRDRTLVSLSFFFPWWRTLFLFHYCIINILGFSKTKGRWRKGESEYLVYDIVRTPFPLLHWSPFQFSSVQSLSCVRLFATPWTAACQASLSITDSWSSLRLTSVESVMLSIQPSHLLSSPSPHAPNPSQHQSLFQWVNSSHEVAKVLEILLELSNRS